MLLFKAAILYAFSQTASVVRSQVTHFMLTICRASKPDCTTVANINSTSAGRRAISTLLISGVVMLGVTGCGQKGALYLENADSQTGQISSEMLESTSHPQDAAFAGIDDDNRQKPLDAQKNQNFELPEPSNDPND